LSILEDVKTVLGQVLSIQERAQHFNSSTALFGTIPEFDSRAVVTLVIALEERFGIMVADDEISADIFGTVGSLAAFVEAKLSR
jgi:acyl carrier protein